MLTFELITGPMFSGKTTTLSKRLRSELDAGARIALLRPALDTRQERSIGFINPTYRIAPEADPETREIAAKVRGMDIVAIDEVQFIAGWTGQLLDALTDTDTQVIAAGLDLMASGEAWSGMAALAARADRQQKLTGVCARCGAPATMTLSTAATAKGLRIGDAGYQPVCRACWNNCVEQIKYTQGG